MKKRSDFIRILIILFIVMPIMALTDLTVSNASIYREEEYGTGWIPPSQEEIDSMEEVFSVSPKTALPKIVDLSSNVPRPGNQGSQGSCVAWAVGYALKSQQEQLERNWGVNITSHQFSPAYIYNQINGGVDEGSSIYDAMMLIQDQGVCSLADMPYSSYNFKQQPNASQRAAASKYKAISLSYISGGNVEEIKNQLYNQNPVIIGGIEMYNSFENINKYNPVYNKKDYLLRGGTHAVCLVGYDDELSAFKFINSWGTNWGLGGYGYISYDMIRNDKTYGYILNDKIDVRQISLNKNEMELFIDNYERLTISVSPQNASIKNITWYSSNPSVATVTPDGIVQGISQGETVITAKSEDPDLEYNTTSCNVVVSNGKIFRGYIDSPKSEERIGWIYTILGWGLYTPDSIHDGITDIKIYVDGVEIGTAERNARFDVERENPGYINYENCGFKYELDTIGISDGEHTLEVKFYDQNGSVVGTLLKTIVTENKGKEFIGYIDKPESGEKATWICNLRGWGLYTPDSIHDGITDVKIYVDGIEAGTAERRSRPDVEKKYPGYVNYENCGFEYELDTTEMSNGEHILEVKFYGQNRRIVGILSKSIVIENRGKEFTGYIDKPESGEKATWICNLRGWGLYTPDGIHDGISDIKIYVDGIETGTAERRSRPDVEGENPGYINYENCGFEYELDTTEISNGTHILEVKFYGQKGRVVGKLSKSIVIENRKKEFAGYIDKPKSGENSTWICNLRGWGLYTPDGIHDGISDIKIYVDGIETGTAERRSRPDVESENPGYINYENCGFEYELDTTEISNGDHILEVKFYGQNGRIVGTLSKTIIIENEGKGFSGYIDKPESGEKASGICNLEGWGLYTPDGIHDGITDIKIYVNELEVGTAERRSRPDVEDENPGYINYENCGFEYELDTTLLMNGNNTLQVKFYDQKRKVVGILSKIVVVDNVEKEFSFYIDTLENDETVIWIDNIFG